jgi:hypothetical protein
LLETEENRSIFDRFFITLGKMVVKCAEKIYIFVAFSTRPPSQETASIFCRVLPAYQKKVTLSGRGTL